MEKKVPLWQEKGSAHPSGGAGGLAIGTAYPSGGRGFSGASGRGARCPAYPAGVPISPEKWGERGPGASPLDPRVLWPACFAARSFWRSCHIVPVMGLFRSPSSYPDLGTFFHKMLFQHIFSKNASQIGLRISEGIAPRTDQGQQPPKRASGNERPLTQGGRGHPPRLFASGLSLESLDPRPGPGGNPPRRC